MKIAITGGMGFVGQAVLAGLGENHDAIVLSRSPDTRYHSIAGRVFSVRHTDYSGNSLFKRLDGYDAVVHLAATRPSGDNDEIVFRNVTLDMAVFRACEAHSIKNIVFSSSRMVYGKQPVPWTEETSSCPNNVYALGKLQSELTADYFNRRGLAIKTLRLAQVLGPGERAGSMIATFLEQAQQKKTLRVSVTDGIIREYIYVKDVASAIYAALQRPDLAGIFNVGSGETCTVSGLAQMVNAAFENEGNLELAAPLTDIREYSLMDSQRFQAAFGWQPQWSIAAALADVRETWQN